MGKTSFIRRPRRGLVAGSFITARRPATWHLTTIDTAALLAAGAVGVSTHLGTATTNVPYAATVYGLTVGAL